MTSETALRIPSPDHYAQLLAEVDRAVAEAAQAAEQAAAVAGIVERLRGVGAARGVRAEVDSRGELVGIVFDESTGRLPRTVLADATVDAVARARHDVAARIEQVTQGAHR